MRCVFLSNFMYTIWPEILAVRIYGRLLKLWHVADLILVVLLTRQLFSYVWCSLSDKIYWWIALKIAKKSAKINSLPKFPAIQYSSNVVNSI